MAPWHTLCSRVRSISEIIAGLGRQLGFALVGTTPLAPLERAAFCHAWAAEGRAGEMHWLAARMAERTDPHRRWTWARGFVVVAWAYRAAPPLRGWQSQLRGRIAAYALGRDYHDLVRGRLRTLGQQLRARLGGRWLAYVDTGPILEREWAARAGLGWIGKHTLVLHRELGSWILLGVLVTDMDLPATPATPDYCGTCSRCLEACPTQALAPRVMDPRRCISYLTIEHRSAIPPALRPGMGNWVFGCDLCQEVCPWNREADTSADTDFLWPRLPELLALDEAQFKARYRGTAVLRATRAGLARNAAVALGNSGNPDAVAPLAQALATDPAPVVRAHAAWALGVLGGAPARAALDRAAARETDPAAAAEIGAARAAIGDGAGPHTSGRESAS